MVATIRDQRRASVISTWTVWVDAGRPLVLVNGGRPVRGTGPFQKPLSVDAAHFLAALPPEGEHCCALIWDVSRGPKGPWCQRNVTRPGGWCTHHEPRLAERREREKEARAAQLSLITHPMPYTHALLLADILSDLREPRALTDNALDEFAPR